jgi:secreted trypsin-like serine protease
MNDGNLVSHSDFPAITKVFAAANPEDLEPDFCTATWVHSDVLLTAAHCVTEDDSKANSKAIRRVWVEDPETRRRVMAKIGKVRIHPRYPEPTSIDGSGPRTNNQQNQHFPDILSTHLTRKDVILLHRPTPKHQKYLSDHSISAHKISSSC